MICFLTIDNIPFIAQHTLSYLHCFVCLPTLHLFCCLFSLFQDASLVAFVQAMVPKATEQTNADLGDDEAATPGAHIAPAMP